MFYIINSSRTKQKIVKIYSNTARMQDNRERFYTLSRDELDSKFPSQYQSNMIWIISNDFRNLQHEKILGFAMGVSVSRNVNTMSAVNMRQGNPGVALRWPIELTTLPSTNTLHTPVLYK